MTNTPVTLVPIGRRSDGSTGYALDGSDIPLASVIEVQATLPTVDDLNNFVGRVVFSIANGNVYVWTDDPSDQWIELRNTSVVDVGVPAPSLAGNDGDLYYSTTTEILYLYVDPEWIPVGGARGSSIIWRYYTGDGSTTLYDTGATTNPPVDYVQVFVDGLGRRPGTAAPLRDYYMVGNNVQLNFTPSNGTAIAIRTVTFMSVARNSTFIVNRYVSDGDSGTNNYSTGVLQAQAGQIFVTVDGVMQVPDTGAGDGTYDYRVVSQNTDITSMTSVGTTVTVTTEVAHGFLVGNTVKIYGAQQSQYNGTFSVTNTPSATEFTYTAASTPSSSPATPYPSLYFGPTRTNDYVVFVDSNGDDSNLVTGSVILIRAIENIIATATAGGVDDQPIITVSEAGTGTGIYQSKSGSQIVLKTLVSGQNISISETTDEITFSSNSNYVWNYTTFNGVSGTYPLGAYDVYIAVKNASSAPVEIDLSSIAPDPANTGRFVIIKDAAFNADTYDISIHPHSTSKIERKDGTAFGTVGADLILDTKGELVALIFNGNDWEMMWRHPGTAGPIGPAGAAGPDGDPGTDAYVSRVIIDGSVDPYSLPTGGIVSYIGVNNTSGSTVTIDIYSNVDDIDDVGRKVVIKDEGGNAGTHNIIINPGASRAIDGGINGATLSISSNYGSYTLVFNGTKYLTV
jgi:hypothetical protein